jgi:O-acetylhomoserine/O-acetylserine sulfhydrylase-like pyridoxal-dependent enzyme
MTTSQRMERQFFLQFIRLVDEVQGKEKLKSQFHSNTRSHWVKQISNPRQKSDSLSRV